MADSIPAAQGISKTISEKIPFTGTWFYPNEGVDQIIFPDFQVEGSTDPNEIYWPSAQLANLYTAWSPQQVAGAPYTATITSENGIKERLDAVQNSSTGGVNYINAYGAVGGFTDVLQQIYGGMVFGPNAQTQSLINQGKSTADALYESLAKDVAAAYSNNSAFKPFGEKYFGTSETPTLTAGAVQQSLQQMSIIISSNPEQIINQSTDVWDQYQTAKAEGQSALTTFQNKLATSLIQGGLDWGTTFNSGFGTVGMFGYEYNMPWDDSLYTQYKTVISNPQIVAWQNAATTVQSGNAQLIRNLNYLADLRTKNNTITEENPSGLFTSTSTSLFNPVKQGPNGALPYAPRWSTTPINGGGTNSIEFDIQTDKVDSQTTNFKSETQWSAEADASVKGWFYSAKVSTSTGNTTKKAWSKMDEKAETMTGTFTWNDMESKQVNPSSLWWFPSAVSQAWSQIATVNDPNFETGFGFLNPKTANQYITSDIYRLSSIAYGTPSAVVEGASTDKSKYTESNFESSYSNASASGGVGWGPFSFGASSTYSTSQQKSSDALKFSETDTGFTVTNNPLDGLTAQPNVGSASAILGFTVTPIGNSQGQPLSSDSSSARGKKKGGEGLFTFTAADDANKKHYHDLAGGNDTHYGGSGKSIIDGGKGHDTLAGLDGNDILDGQKGKDVIYPGKGKKNIVYLGKGDDFVVFEKDDLGFTVVKDFAEGDRLSFSGFSASDLKFEGKVLMEDDVEIAKFKGKGIGNLLENAIEDAHYSLPSEFTAIDFIS